MAAPFRVGEELELTVDSLAAGGRGVARHDGVVVFVDRALPGDRVMARIQRVKRRHGEAIAFERLSGGPDRVEAPCPHFGTCGGCRWQDLRYERQLEHKQQQVLDALQRIAGLPEPPIEPIVPAVREYAYRNKLEYAWTSTPDGRLARLPQGGPLGGDRPHPGLPADGRRRQRRARGVPRLGARRGPRGLRPARATPASSGTWSCARACARASCSASSSPPRGELTGVESLQALLDERALGVVGVLHAVNDGVAEVASGIPTRPLFGRSWFEEEISGLRLRVSAGSFLQTNTEMADVLYQDAIEQAGADRRRDRLGPVLRRRARSALRSQAPRAA